MSDTEQILSELYALRAGLSVISEQKDEVDKIKSATDEKANPVSDEIYANMLSCYFGFTGWQLEESYQRENAELRFIGAPSIWEEECTSYVGNRKEVLKKFHDQRVKYGRKRRTELQKMLRSGDFSVQFEDYFERAEKDSERAQSLDKAHKKKACLALIPFFIGVVAILISIFVFSAIPIAMGIGIALGAILALVGIILIATNCKYISGKAWYAWQGKNITRMREFLAEIMQKSAQLEVWEKEANEQIFPYKLLSEELYDTLVKTYAKTLDPRDWKYVDLVIFYFETGRADNMRDALQQLDRERQTQEIVGAVREATSMICRTIEREMSALRSTISAGFTTLSNNIRALQNSVDSGFAQMAAIGQAQLNEARLGNALRAKANATSEQLMNDVHFMKTQMYY